MEINAKSLAQTSNSSSKRNLLAYKVTNIIPLQTIAGMLASNIFLNDIEKNWETIVNETGSSR